MGRILNFTDFINEASFPVREPKETGEELANILGQTRNVKEIPSGSNKGPEVEQYLKSVGLGAGQPWCQAYVYWALNELSKKMGISNPAPKSGSVKGHWDDTPQENRITVAQAKSNPSLVRPGMVFVLERNTPWSQGGYQGHTGIILTVDPDKRTYTSIEGNTDEKATGEGNKVGVNTRSIDDKSTIGFVDWFKGQRTPEFEAAIAGGGVKPQLPGDTGGEITGEFMTVNQTAPTQNTVGDADAEAAALRADQAPASGLAAYLLKPWRPDQSLGTEVSSEEVAKFLGRKTNVEKYKASLPPEPQQ